MSDLRPSDFSSFSQFFSVFLSFSQFLRKFAKLLMYELPDGSRTCRFKYPHPLQPVTTFDPDGRIHYRRRKPGDEMIVPHCLPLLRKFQCHINFKVANTSHIFQYLFKYIHKGMFFVHMLLHHHQLFFRS